MSLLSIPLLACLEFGLSLWTDWIYARGQAAIVGFTLHALREKPGDPGHQSGPDTIETLRELREYSHSYGIGKSRTIVR